MRHESRDERGSRMTTVEPAPAPDLPLPPSWPTPAPRCGVCAALARQRREDQAAGDYSRVSDANVEIRQHPTRHRRRRS